MDPDLEPDHDALFLLRWYNPMTWIRTAWKIGRFRPDCLVYPWTHTFFGFIFFWLNAMVRLTSPKTKILYVCHNVLPHKASWLDPAFRGMGFLGVSDFIVHATQERDALLEFKPKARIQMALPGSNLYPGEMEHLTAEEAVEWKTKLGLRKPRTILFFGYVRPYKGLRYLVEALKEIPESDLLVVGEFWQGKEEYLRLAEEMGVSERLFIVDHYVPNPDIRKYFSVADVVALPYVSATQSGPIQLAYLFERPMVVTAVGGLVDAVQDGETGYLVPPSDSKALAEAVNRYFAEKPDFSAAIAQYKQRHTWESYAGALESFLK